MRFSSCEVFFLRGLLSFGEWRLNLNLGNGGDFYSYEELEIEICRTRTCHFSTKYMIMSIYLFREGWDFGFRFMDEAYKTR